MNQNEHLLILATSHSAVPGVMDVLRRTGEMGKENILSSPDRFLGKASILICGRTSYCVFSGGKMT